MAVSAVPVAEAVESFACFGGWCSVLVQGSGPAGSAPEAAERAKRRLLSWHNQFSRFDPASELSRMNADPRECLPVTPMMARFVHASIAIAEMTGGLVDPTLLSEVEKAGYTTDLGDGPATAAPLDFSAPRQPARPARPARWRQLHVDLRASTVTRPPGLKLDSGGVAKGLFGDALASLLSWHESFAVAAAGDVRLGGSGEALRAVEVTHPFAEREVLHSFELSGGAAATSGITRRSWSDDRGRAAHHLLDPSTGRPAFTGIAQATALAPSGVVAEALAKAALLSGPEGAQQWLPHGGLLVYDDGSHLVLAPGLRR